MKTKFKLLLVLLPLCFLLQSQVSINSPKQNSEIIEKSSDAKAVADIVYADEVIIQASLCVGFDCINGESFGFDTQRFKENNLRIHFDDTSTGTFPANDWRIIINDSQSEGANYFAIEDATGATTPFKIEAGARTNALYVEADGDVGFGTSDPVVDLHNVTGNTPAIRFEQDGSSGFTPQTWDMAGNEANFFIRDVTGGSSLPLRIRPGAPTSSLDIASSGNVGIGTASPATRLHAKGTADMALRLENAGGSSRVWDIGNDGTKFYISDFTGVKIPFKIDNNALNNALRITPAGAKIETGGLTFSDGSVQTTASIGANGSGTFAALNVAGNSYFDSNVYIKGAILPGASYSPSDANIKENIKSLVDATSVIKNLYPKTFFFKGEIAKEMRMPEGLQYGMIAQDVEKLLPSFVKEFASKYGKKFKSVNYNSFIPILIQGFKEQQETIEKQGNEIKELKSQLAKYSDLEMRIAAIENSQNKKASIKTSK